MYLRVNYNLRFKKMLKSLHVVTKARATKIVVYICRLLKFFRSLLVNQCGPRSDCSRTLFASILSLIKKLVKCATDDLKQASFSLTGAFRILVCKWDVPGRITQSVTCLATDACLTADQGVASSIPVRPHTFMEIDHEMISTVILLLPLIHSRRVVVSYKRKYVHELLVNCLFKPAQEKVWLGELTVPQ